MVMPSMPDPDTIPAFPSQAAQSNAQTFAATTLVLHGLALVVFVGRVYTRLVPACWMHGDDYVCVLAYILILVNSALLLAAIPYTFNHSPTTFFLSSAQSAFKYASIAQPLWAWSIVSIKCSFALMLLRIGVSKPFRRFLWAMIALQIALGIYNTLATLLQCVPVRKAWDLLGIVEGQCWSKRTVGRVSISASVINIATDFTLALLPLSFLRQLRRPLRERVVLGFLMGLGVFAGVASILKIVAAARFASTGDLLSESVNIGMWSVVEELVGFIVICVPCLRGPLQRSLACCGVVSARLRQRGWSRGFGRTYEHEDETGDALHHGKNRVCLDGVKEDDTESGVILNALRMEISSHGDAAWRDGPKGKGEIWCTKEVTVQNDFLEHTTSLEQSSSVSCVGWLDESFDLADATRLGCAM